MKKLTILAVLVLFLAGIASAQQKTTVSVMDLNATSGLSAKELALLTDKLLGSLVEYRVFEVVERSKRDEILREQGFQMTGACSDASCLVEVGQLLGAQKMIGGTIGKLGSLFVVELRMIDIKTGGIDLSFSRNYKKIAELLNAMREAAEIFSSWKPGAGLSAKPGGLFISSEPEGAKILVDGKEHPKTTPDLVYPLAEGLHQVSLVKDGFSLYSASRLVSIGKIDTVSAPLMSLAGKLRISVEPLGARMYLGKKFQGISTPQPIVIEGLTDTAYSLKIQKWGYRIYRSTFSTNPGRETRINASLPLARWALRWEFDYMKGFSPSSEGTAVDLGSSAGQAIAISQDDFKGSTAIGGTAGAGFAATRNLAVSVMYQFRIYPQVVKKNQFVSSGWPSPTAVNYDLETSLIAHSVLGGLTLFVPVGRLEPYLEVRYGGSGAKIDGNFERRYSTWSSSLGNYVEDSTLTDEWDEPIAYTTLQAGGGFKVWLHPLRPALRVYWLYNKDWFKGLPQPMSAEKVDVSVSGMQFGAGFTVNFY